MDKSRAEDKAASTGRDEDSSLISSSQTSVLKRRLTILKESRAFSIFVRPSALSVAGAGIGIVSILLLTWGIRSIYVPIYHPLFPSIVDVRYILVTEHLSFFDFLAKADPPVVLSLTVFLVGTVLAIFMPIFGFLQGLGLVGFIFNSRSAFSEYPVIYGQSPEISELGLGYYLAIGSTFIVIMSSKVLYGRRIEDRPVPASLRIATLSPYATRLRK